LKRSEQGGGEVMSNPIRQQSTFFRGIYDFSDPSGAIVAAKVPASGSVDLYSGTAVIVRPNQTAIFIYKGTITDIFESGTHIVNTENLPILSQLTNWRFDFQNPLRCELFYISHQIFVSRRWGSPQPIIVNFEDFGSIPIRAYGNFHVKINNPLTFFKKLMGTRMSYGVSDVDEFIQGLILEAIPSCLNQIKKLEQLPSSYESISTLVTQRVQNEIIKYGFFLENIQLLSAIPSKEVIEALEAKTAIKIIGSQKDYLIYQAAKSLNAATEKNATANDPLQMMMGLMLSKGIIGADYHDKEDRVRVVAPLNSAAHCQHCQLRMPIDSKFCSQCGKKV
jgi:membrane protease subunit (stomatin/prohibitin family)